MYRLLLMVVALGLSGCDQVQQQSELNGRIRSLEAEVAVLKNVNNAQEHSITAANLRIMQLEDNRQSEWATFDPAKTQRTTRLSVRLARSPSYLLTSTHTQTAAASR